MRYKKTGQSTLEYMVLVTIILGAFMVGGVYVKRGIQGRWKTVVDDLGDQYDPRVSNTVLNYTLNSNAEVQIITLNDVNGVWTNRLDTSDSLEVKQGAVRIGAY